MKLMMLLEWWNLIFVIPFFLALFYLALYVFTGLTFGDADADADIDADADLDTDAEVSGPIHVEAHVVDVDADADVDADVDADADADVDADADADADHDADSPGTSLAHAAHVHVGGGHAGGGHSFASDFLSFLGIGKIPISLALTALFFSWGIVGFAINSLLVEWIGVSLLVPVISIPLAFAISLALTGLFAAFIAKLIPNDGGSRERKEDFVGKSGEAIYDIDAAFGMANVRGIAGGLFQVPCRTVNGTGRIPKGARVVLFHYDREKGVFHVAPFDA